jgi:hypothetical protein
MGFAKGLDPSYLDFLRWPHSRQSTDLPVVPFGRGFNR